MPNYNIEFICENNTSPSLFDYLDITANDTIHAREITLNRFKRDTKPLLYNIIKVKIEYKRLYINGDING